MTCAVYRVDISNTFSVASIIVCANANVGFPPWLHLALMAIESMRSFAEAGNNYVTTLIDSFMLGWERSGRTGRDNRNSPGKHDLNLIAGICFFPLSYSRHRDHYVGMCRYRDVNVNIILRISPSWY